MYLVWVVYVAHVVCGVCCVVFVAHAVMYEVCMCVVCGIHGACCVMHVVVRCLLWVWQM